MLLSLLTSRVNRLFKSRRVRRFLHLVRTYIVGSKSGGSFTFHLHSYLHRLLRNSKKRLLRSAYIRDLSRAISKYCKSYRTARKGICQVGSYDGFERWGRRPRRQDPFSSYDLTPSTSTSRAKGGGEVRLNSTEYVDDLTESNYNNNFVIDLYDESNLPSDLQTSRSSSLLNRTVDPYADFREPQSSDSSRNEQRTNESIEYDEDEANESIQNCYLYNGYINARMFEKSDEYKFMKEHLLDSESRNLKINIGNEQTCGSDSSGPGWGKNQSTSLKQKAKRIYTQGRLKQKKERRRRRYEIYNTETTAKQNLYCSNYLNENFHSSSSVSSISVASSSASSSASSFDSSVYNSYSDKETASLGSKSFSDSADESSA